MSYLGRSGSRRNNYEGPTRDDADKASDVFTAVPSGRDWRVKVLSPDGEITLLGRFDSRLPALGAAVLLAARAEGRVLP